MEAFHCKEPEERNIYLTRLILSFVTYEVFFKVDSATEEKSAEKSEVTLNVFILLKHAFNSFVFPPCFCY